MAHIGRVEVRAVGDAGEIGIRPEVPKGGLHFALIGVPLILTARQISDHFGLSGNAVTRDNDHVQVADIRGTAADDLRGALLEIEATAQGTKCQQPFFQVIVPPQNPTILGVCMRSGEATRDRADNILI